MLIGQSLNHYRIEERLGIGGMGEVYLARDTRLDRRVALKILTAGLPVNDEHRTRFEREAKAIAALNHPNIVTIHSVEKADDVHFITMELVEGKTLTETIPPDGLPLDRLLELAVPLADAVSAAHRAGITHRDLKPDNVMIDPEGRLKVLDFGLAKLRDQGEEDETEEMGSSVTEEGTIIGTAAYMSPEQAQGRAVDPRSDVFSLGIILFQMASGKRPFSGDSRVSLLFSIMSDPSPSLTEVRPAFPRHMSRIVKRCLEKDPERRYQSALELRNELAELKQEFDSGALPPSSYKRRQRRAAGLGLALAAAVVVILIAVFQGFDFGSREAGDSGPSIAVLPFKNLSPDQENEYFAEGITEEITSKLSRIRNLEVASRTSVERFKDTTVDARQIGEELGVGYLLEGSVRKADRRVRITAQLVETANGFHLWAEDFDGELDDVFGVQEETALKIAEALDLRLTPGEKEAVQRRYTGNPQAYDAYLRGRALIEYFATADKLESAREHFERALELDPDYPLALVGLSRVEAQFYRNLDPREQRLQRAEELARRALEIDNEIAEAHLALGQVVANRYLYREAVEEFREAIRLEPGNAYAWDLLSWALAYQQPPDPAAAEEAARRSISLQASLIGAHYHLGRALLLQDRFDEAIEAFEQSKRLDPAFESADYGIAQVYIAQEDYDTSLAYLDRLGDLARSPVVSVQRCCALAGLGRYDEAFEALDVALSTGYSDLAGLEASECLRDFRNDPRFRVLLERHGVAR